MKKIVTVFAVAALAAAISTSTAYSAPGDTYKAKKAACQERAKAKNFGVHVIKKSRWVKDCIAGKHPA